MKKSYIRFFVSVGSIFYLTLVSGIQVQASEWKANTPDQIKISTNEKEYTMQSGDTLWAIGTKLNIKYERIAEINNINLTNGDQYHIPIGRVISIEGNVATVKEANGDIVSQSIIREKDKVVPSDTEDTSEIANTESTSEEASWSLPAEMRLQLIDVGFDPEFVDNLSQSDYNLAVERANEKLAQTGYGDVGTIFYELDNMFPGSWKHKPDTSYSSSSDS